MPRPLDGITVVSLEHAIAAPFCTRQLADLGARVIKVERPGSGDFARAYDDRAKGLSSHFVWVNRSKESLTLDLKQPAAMEVLKDLLARADVLVQNLAPGAAARMGLSYAQVSALHPRLVVCDVSGYGNDGPYRDKKAYDLLIQSEAGFLSVTGTPDEPSKSGNSIADIAAGMYAYSSVLAALLQRQQTGRGSHVDVSMLESLGEWMGFPMYYAYEGAEPPPRSGASHATIYPYGPFEAGDGKTVMLGLQNEREWKVFCDKVLLQPALAADPRFDANAKRNANRAALKKIILAAFGQLNAEQVIARLEDAQIANAHVNTVGDMWSHPQLRARDRFRRVGSPVGEIEALLPPGVNSSFDYRMDAIPAVGEHTQAILRELGRSDVRHRGPAGRRSDLTGPFLQRVLHNSSKMQLQDILYTQGFGPRRLCTGLVQNGLVAIEGQVVTDPATDVEAEGLRFTVEGKPWEYHAKAYLMLHKPAGYECSQKPSAWPSIYTLLPAPLRQRPVKGGQPGVQAIGRLDQDTTGLLLMSDDGAFIHRMSSPKHHVPKVYEVGTADPVEAKQVKRLLEGVVLDDDPRPVRAAACEATGEHALRLVLTEGKYHQVKRMLAAVGNRVVTLHRSRIGDLEVPQELAPGQWRWLTAAQLAAASARER